MSQSERTNIRDRVYELQGLLQDKFRMEVSYSKSILDMYFEALRLEPRDASQRWRVQRYIKFSEELRQYLRLKEVEENLLSRIYTGKIFVGKGLKVRKKMPRGVYDMVWPEWSKEEYLVRMGPNLSLIYL